MIEANNSAITNLPSEQTVRTIAASEIPRLAPKLKQYLRRPDPMWPDIVAAADGLRRELGVSKSLWREACLAMGRDLAAVAIALITTKEPGEVRNPEGYFRGMLAKHIAGELHLERTVWRLRSQGKQMTTPVTDIQELDDDPSPAAHQLRQMLDALIEHGRARADAESEDTLKSPDQSLADMPLRPLWLTRMKAAAEDGIEQSLLASIREEGWRAFADGGIPAMHELLAQACDDDGLLETILDHHWDGIGTDEGGHWVC